VNAVEPAEQHCAGCYRRRIQAAQRLPNLSLKKIPGMELARCEWGHDDYRLKVANLPMAQAATQPNLFGDAGEEPTW